MKIEKRIERFEIIPRIRKKKYALQHVEILLGIIRALSLSLSLIYYLSALNRYFVYQFRSNM